MGEIKIRKIDDFVLNFYRARANANGRSLEEEVRETLSETARASRQQLYEELMEFHRRNFERGEVQSDSTPLIREMRDERG